MIEITEDDVYTHILEVSGRGKENQRLGYVNRNSDQIEILLPLSQVELRIKQSITGLSDSTGFVCWQVALHFVDWCLSWDRCPFKFTSDNVVVELGSGIGAITATLLGPKVGIYIATDQYHLLKLLKYNYEQNKDETSHAKIGKSVSKRKATSNKGGSSKRLDETQISDIKVHFTEFNWEDIHTGVYNIQEITGNKEVDYVIAADTVYNEYLVDPFIDAFESLMTANTTVIVAIFLRDEQLTAFFCEQVCNRNMSLHLVPPELLSEELQKGYLVYTIKKR